MTDLLLLPEMRPFAIAAGMLLGLTTLEVVGLLVGASLSHLVDKSLDHEGWLGHHLGWLNVGQVPLLVLIILVLAAFSATGFVLKAAAGAFGLGLPVLGAVAVAAAVSVPLVRWSSRLVARTIPRDESYAVELDDFVGQMAEVTVGPLDQGLPGRVRLRDVHGNWHVVRARAGQGETSMAVGSRVVLVDRRPDCFLAMPAPDILRPERPNA